MAKASSPVRLESNLMKAATSAGATLHRSAAEQIEYWADIGRQVSRLVDPESLLAVRAGLAKITLINTVSAAVDPDDVFAKLDRDRDSGQLSQQISNGSIRYQASVSKPGFLDQVHPDGRVLTGQFINGDFQEHTE